MGITRLLPLTGRALWTAGISLLLSFFLLLQPVLAQEGGLLPGESLADNPKEREVTVSATAPVQNGPPPPILIRPEDGALLNSGAIGFRWKLQDHIVAYTKQELVINGVTVYFDIPLNNYETTEYKLTYENGEYLLQLKPGYHLPDGDYTWRVQVLDVNNRGTSSTTWIFTVDSQSPQLLVTEIEEYDTAISSLDATTVPEEPFVVQDRTPDVVGKTESNATVELTVVFPDGRTEFYTTIADSSGNFAFTLPPLTRGELVELRFSAIDDAGNTSALSGIFVVYEPAVLFFPLLPPFLLPDVPTLEIPLDLPLVTIPEIPVPPVLEEPIDGITTQYELTRQLLEELLPYLPWIGLGMFVDYLLLLFFLTGSSWGFLALFLGSWLKAWFFGWKREQHVWRDQVSLDAIPGLGFEIHTLVPGEDKIQKQRVVTSLGGEWSIEIDLEKVHSLELQNRKWSYPVAGRFSETWLEKRELWLYGESFTWKSVSSTTQAAAKNWQTSAECFVLPEDLSGFQFVAWGWKSHATAPVWTRFLPRVLLIGALLLAATVVLLSPNLLSLIGFVLVLWILFRDIIWNVPELWKVHFTTEKKVAHAE